MLFDSNQIVETRECGIANVVDWQGKPAQLIFKTFSRYADEYDEHGKHKKNSKLDVVKIYDGSSVADMRQIFSSKFSCEGLPVVYEEKQ